MSFTPNVSVRRHQISPAGKFPLIYEEYLPLAGKVRADVLLVHGLASSSQQFVDDALHFAERGYRVLVPDLRGHGASGVPDGRLTPAQFAISVMAQDLIDLLDHADAQNLHWVGNSLGGILALHLLGTHHSQRLKSLTLFGTCFSMDLPAHALRALRAAFLPGNTVTGWITARATTASTVGRKAIEAAIRQFNVAAGAAIAANVRSYDFIANARAYDRPMLVLRGGKDHAVNLRLRRDLDTITALPNVQRIDLPFGGHCANFDMPEAFRAALLAHWERADTPPVSLAPSEVL